MTLPMDYHIHSRFSPDSFSEPEDICRRALEVGIEEICITDHFDLNPHEKTFDPAEYLQEIDRCREVFGHKLVIRSGLELGEPHLYQPGLQDLTRNYCFDYLLGSIHWLGEELIGPDYLSKKEFSEACREYLGLVYEATRVGPYQCIGHLDMVKRHSTGYYGKSFLYEDFREEVDSILNSLVENGRGLEVNTSGWRQGVGESYPGLSVLKRYHELGGEIITLGSDSHRIPQLGSGIEEGLELVKAAGFKAITRFECGKPLWQDI